MSIVHPNPLEVAAADAILEDSPTEVVMDDIVASTTAINEASDEVGEISRNVEELGNAAASVESYTTRFLEQVSAESWNPRLAHQYEIGMAAILKTCGVTVPSSVFCASFEAAGVTQTNEENRNETKGKSEGVIKRLWATFLEMLTKLWDNIQNFTAFLGNSTNRLRKLSENLRARVTKTKSDGLELQGEGKLTGKWATYLTTDIGGGGHRIAGNPSAALEGMAEKALAFTDEWYKNYLGAVEDMAEGNFTSMNKGDNGDMASLSESLKNLLSPAIKNHAGAWPGGYVVSVQRNESHLDRLDLDVKFKPETGVEAKVLSLAEIIQVADTIKDVAGKIDTEMKKMQDGKSKIDAVKKKMEAAIKGGEKPINGKVVSLASALMGDMMVGPRKTLPLLAGACTKAGMHCDASLATYKAAKK